MVQVVWHLRDFALFVFSDDSDGDFDGAKFKFSDDSDGDFNHHRLFISHPRQVHKSHQAQPYL